MQTNPVSTVVKAVILVSAAAVALLASSCGQQKQPSGSGTVIRGK